MFVNPKIYAIPLIRKGLLMHKKIIKKSENFLKK